VASLVTPGVSSTKESTRRPLIGRFMMSVVPTTAETSVLVSVQKLGSSFSRVQQSASEVAQLEVQ